MTKTAMGRLIVGLEVAGFLLLVAMAWLDEILDLPHLVAGVPETPVNIVEAGIETCIIILVGIAVAVTTRRLLARLQYLEGFVSTCANCKKIRDDGRWLPIELYVSQRSEARFSHTICPTCMAKLFPDIVITREET